MLNQIVRHDASASDWEVARQREAVIRPLAEQPCLTPAVVGETAQTLNLKRSVVYKLVAQYRKRPQTSTLLLGHSGRPRGSRLLEPEREALIQDAIEQYYLTRQRPRVADLVREIGVVCQQRGLRPPNFRSVKRRLNAFDPGAVMKARMGGKAADAVFRPVGIRSSNNRLLPMDPVQIDHTPIDVIVVGERDRLPIGRPYLTMAIDVATRTVPGFCISLEPPSTLSVALVLTHAVLPKEEWLADRELRIQWPVAGLPNTLHLDNAPEFHAESGEDLNQIFQDETKFGTYWEDSSTGFSYADQRYYASKYGRFLSADLTRRARTGRPGKPEQVLFHQKRSSIDPQTNRWRATAPVISFVVTTMVTCCLTPVTRATAKQLIRPSLSTTMTEKTG